MTVPAVRSSPGVPEIRIVILSGIRRKFVFPVEGLAESVTRLPCPGG